MTIKFYDTCSLLKNSRNLFLTNEKFAISSITLKELEEIKSSSHKDADVKYTARKITRMLEEHYGEYDIIIYREEFSKQLSYDYEVNNDIKILSCAIEYMETHPCDKVIFYTNDLCLKNISQLYLDEVESVEEDKDYFTGFKKVYLSEEELSHLYENMNENIYNLLINEYLAVYNENKEILDYLCWTGERYRKLNYDYFNSRWFGKVRPIQGDICQMFAADSLTNNKISVVKGPAGSGKSYLSLGYLFYKLDKQDIDKIIIFCNPVATKNSARLGSTWIRLK